jgi:hypothetical protein
MALDWNTLDKQQKAEMVSTALAGQRQVGQYGHLYMKLLEKARWVRVIRVTPAGYTVYEVTPEAVAVLLTIPDDYAGLTWYPLKSDVQAMKAKLTEQRSKPGR